MRKSCMVFSSSWSRVKQAEALDEWQNQSPAFSIESYKGNCGQI